MSYVGGPGFELYVPIEMARHVYLALHGGRRRPRPAPTPATTRSTPCASRPAGAPGAPSSARTRRRSRPGSLFAVKLDKADDFIGRDALLARQAQPLAQAAASRCVLDIGRRLGLGRRGAAARRRAGRRDHLGRLEPAGRRLRRPRLRARRGGGRAPRRHARSRSTSGASASPPPPGTRPRGCSARRPVSDARAVLAALDRRAGVRAVAAVRPRRGRDPAGRRPERARPRRLGRAGRARRHPDRHRLARLQPAGVAPHHPLRRALGDRRRRRLVRAGDGDLHVRVASRRLRDRRVHDRHGQRRVRPGAAELSHRGGALPLSRPGAVDARRRDADRPVHRPLPRRRGDPVRRPGRRLRRRRRGAGAVGAARGAHARPAGRARGRSAAAAGTPARAPPPTLRAIAAGHATIFLTVGVGALLVSAVRASRQAVVPLWADHIGLDAADHLADLRPGRRHRHAGVLSGRQGHGPQGPRLGRGAVDAAAWAWRCC